ncbi:MAG: NYN domain-containing protein [Candidatus Woesearchaeota archaeon]
MNAYVDGSNFYHSCKRAFGIHRVDLVRVAERMLLGDETLSRIKYFTTSGNGQLNQNTQEKHHTFLARLKETGRIDLHFGKLANRPLGHIMAACPSCGCRNVKTLSCPDCGNLIRTKDIQKSIEKGVDVQLATVLLLDAAQDSFDLALLFSNDADFSPAIKAAINQFHKKVVYCSFPRRPTGELLQICSENRIITKNIIERASRKR